MLPFEILPVDITPDERAPKHGWKTGWYGNKCSCCGKLFIGAKGAWNCADCAYTFDDQLTYEYYWRQFAFPVSWEYIQRKMRERNEKSS